MRGPGQYARAPSALEQAIDELAEKLGLDPLALRDRIDPSPVRREERRIGAERIGWQRRHQPGADPGPVKRGLGVAQSLWGANVQLNSSCEVRVMRDGSVEVLSSVQDIGTGIGTVLAQIVAEDARPSARGHHGAHRRHRVSRRAAVLRQPYHRLDHAAGAHRRVARAADVISRGCAGSERGRRRSDLHERTNRRSATIRAAASASAKPPAGLRTDRISAVASRSDDYGGFRRRMGDAALAQQDFGGVQFAEVAVDTETGIVRVERVVAVQDCGRPINPRQIESQVQGGVLMGLSYALFEERILDQHTGRMVNPESGAIQARRRARDARHRRRRPGKLSGPKRDRRLRHRRAGQHRHRAGHRQCRLQRDRRPPSHSADDAGGGSRRPWQSPTEELKS